MTFAELRKLKPRVSIASSGKITPHKFLPDALPADTLVTAMIEVNEDGYDPGHLKIRSRVDQRMFTAEFKAGDVTAIEADPRVMKITVSEILPLVRQPR